MQYTESGKQKEVWPESKTRYQPAICIKSVFPAHRMPRCDASTFFFQVYANFGVLTFSYLVSVVLHLLLEAPVAGLEKIIFPKK